MKRKTHTAPEGLLDVLAPRLSDDADAPPWSSCAIDAFPQPAITRVAPAARKARTPVRTVPAAPFSLELDTMAPADRVAVGAVKEQHS